jgi:transposase
MIHHDWRWIMRFDLSDEEWGLLESLIPKARKTARADDRRVMDGIFYVLRTGMPRRDLPERYGPYTTIYNRFNRWSRRGIWKKVFDTLAERSHDSLHIIDREGTPRGRRRERGRKINRSASAGAAARRKATRSSTAKVGRPTLS